VRADPEETVNESGFRETAATGGGIGNGRKTEPGVNVMILNIFSPNDLAIILVFLTQDTANYAEEVIIIFL
jgi:hypothetical protein